MIKLIISALRKPVTVMVALLAIVFFAVLAIRNMSVDIFPKLGTPTIYVAQTYGGLAPDQIEGFMTSYYEYHFLYINGIKEVESKTIQGVSLMKLTFHEGTDMSQALAEVVAQVNRSRAFMPPGTVPPFITRFDGGGAPVGQLVFSSETRSLGEIQDLALFKVRPKFASIPGVSAPPPFGGNQRTVLIKADPSKLRSYNISPDELVMAIAKGNTISPSGNIRTADKLLIANQNTVVSDIQELANIPLKKGSGPAVYVRDVAEVQNGSDVASGYALINGSRSVYIPVTKRASASTWDVVKQIKANLPDMQAAVPDDIKVSYEFDQSGYVINSLKTLSFEGVLGAMFTGLMVLLFLGDRRSALIVILTIPLAILSAIVCLYLAGQTINIMTLGGLALAIGILVDESTVTIENIHRHQEMGKKKARAILDACKEIALPKLLILISILAVFVPSFFMSGTPRAMFLPLTLAVGFAMIASFLLSQTMVPILTNWFLKDHVPQNENGKFHRFRDRITGYVKNITDKRAWTVGSYLVVIIAMLGALWQFTGTAIFPKVNSGQLQVRLRLPDGTRIENTEEKTKQFLELVNEVAGKENVEITSAFVGIQPPSYPVNTIFLWTSGPHEAVVKIKLKEAGQDLDDLKEKLRKRTVETLPEMRLSFEPADLVDQVMSQGANTSVEIAVQGKDLSESRKFAEEIKNRIEGLSFMRDVQFGIPLNYPSIDLEYDRVRAGQLGITIEDISRSVTAATSSSRFTQPNYWLDASSGNAYQVQVEFPQYLVDQPDAIEKVPLKSENGKTVYVGDVSKWEASTMIGEYDRLNQQRFITVTGNIHDKDLGSALKVLRHEVTALGGPPAGMSVKFRGLAETLTQTFNELSIGLLLAVAVIFLLLAASFQSFRLSFAVLSTVPAVIVGSFLLIWISGNTLNIQSFMGSIMAIGVAVANAILFVTIVEQYRKDQIQNPHLEGIKDRLRPILMTSIAMIAGMTPMALGLGEGGEQTAPLGIAVIGGLLFSVFATVFILPAIYWQLIGHKHYKSISLDPDDEQSTYFGQ
ncbi:efflux RND transporter permease subunit [Algoriphagus sp. AGSA1]|uniref:efflux RND transporter permease subunit n=1 Tax=unclassified Algoriphagus TaxID=2641541 RepID=UPI0017822731|nr:MULTISPECIES: efflux RND transporter permease subunit [unclassified Algoriphagus]MCE7056228.1 efflux RND transporter permease subunit [Algoriphagus sp. AGSA1]